MSNRKIHFRPSHPSSDGEIILDVDDAGRLSMSCALVLSIVDLYKTGNKRKELEDCALVPPTPGQNGPGSGMSNVQGC